jgi:hypothetical protein
MEVGWCVLKRRHCFVVAFGMTVSEKLTIVARVMVFLYL